MRRTDAFLKFVKSHPLVRRMRRRRGLNYYLSDQGGGLHYGCFESFSAARQWLPPSKAFDHEDFTTEYVEIRTKQVYSFDYPVMFWLRQAFDEGAVSIYDIGGSVGVHYYAYQPFLRYPADLTWRVYELESSVVRGRDLARERGVNALWFTSKLEPGKETADIWMAAGALEFIEEGRLDAMLSSAARKPRHLLLNKLPMHDGDAYVSTQNIGNSSFVPHYVYNRDKFVAGIEQNGFRLVDSWHVHERAFSVPGWPEQSFSPYIGLYFRAV